MSTTVLDLINDTKRALHGTHRGILNKLQTNVDADDTAIVCSKALNFGEGAYIGIEDEIIYVYAASVSSQSATDVERGQLGTTATAHTAGAIIEVEPRFPKVLIRDALQDDIRSWPPSVYRTETQSYAASSSVRSINLDSIGSDFYALLELLRSPYTGTLSNSWVECTGRAEKNLNLSDFSSGAAIFLDEYVETPGATIRATFAMPFDVDTFTDATTLSSIGLTDEMIDIPVLGAAARLLSTREIKRTFTESQGESRRAAEVPPQFIGQVATRLLANRDKRLEEEARRLAYLYPMSMG